MGKMALNGVMRAINRRCSSEGVKDFLAHRECIVNIKKPAQICYHAMVRDLYRISGAETELLHSAICWSVLLPACLPVCLLSPSRSNVFCLDDSSISKMHECNSNALKTACKEEAKQLYGHETERMADDLMELICPANLRWGTSDCSQVDDKLGKGEAADDEDLSILPLIINLMKRLAD